MLNSRVFKLLVYCFGFCSLGSNVMAQTRMYTKTQISSGAFNHEAPSINNPGDVVWSQQVGGFWQVYILHAGTTTPVAVTGQAADHNNQYPTIDDAGDVLYLKDNVGQGVALAVILNHGGAESIIQFSSINVLSGQERKAGKHFGIASNGTTITYFDFLTFGFGPRHFVLSSVGQLAPDFPGGDFPDVNSGGTFVYSSFGTIFSAAVSAPNSPTQVASGEMPRIADVVPPATTPEIVYISGGSQVMSTVGGTVDAGVWADVNNAGAVVYEKQVGGFNQIFLAINGCGHPTFADPYPTSSSPGSAGDPNGWHVSYNVSDQHGLELTDVSLGSRYMAESMNLPYFYLQTSSFSDTRCILTPTGDPTLGMNCTSHLIDFRASGGPAPEIKATYEVDNISTTNPNSCILITQDYQFSPPIYSKLQGVEGCEPTNSLACAKFKPLVSYQFLPGDSTETLAHINTAQRLHFSVDAPPPILSAGRQSTLFVRDLDPIGFLVVGPAAEPDPGHAFLQTETLFDAVKKGGLKGDADNYHQTSEVSVRLPNPPPGCPLCLHMHWRWFSGANVVDPGGNWGSGVPLVNGSDQSVQVAAVRDHPFEEDPQPNFTALVNGESLIGWPVAFWYSATGYQDHDTFFSHGGFFSPPSSGPAKLAVSNVGQKDVGANFEVTLNVANAGPGTAHNVSINQLITRILKGTGAISITAPFVPVVVGDLAPGSSQAVIVTFSVASPVKEFLVQEGISFADDFGQIQGTRFGEILIP